MFHRLVIKGSDITNLPIEIDDGYKVWVFKKQPGYSPDCFN